MKNLITIIFMSLSLMFVGCSSSQVDDSKLKLAKEAGNALEGGLDKLYSEKLDAEFYSSNKCDVEAFKYGVELKEKIEELFDVQQSARKSMLIDSLCMLAVSQALPMVIESSDLAKPCLTKLGSVSAVELGKSICENVGD